MLVSLNVPAFAAITSPSDAPAVPTARPDWPLDADRNGLDDVLDADLAAGAAGLLFLHVHYDHRPTAADGDLLKAEFGALRTYVFRNFDKVKVETSYDRVPGLLAAPGVVGVEKWVPPLANNDVGTRAIRAEAASGVPVTDGKDHLLAVHQLGYRGEGMIIAVLDTGVDNTHESLDDLDDNPATNDPKLLQRVDPATGLTVFGGADTSEGFVVRECIDPVDDESHGTHVAGTALGTGGPSKQFQGVAPQARLVDVDISVSVPGATGVGIGEDLAFDWIVSFNKGLTCYGDPGADRIDVATMSFGAGGSNPSSSQNSGITEAVRAGITFTASAGNGGEAVGTITIGSEGAIIVANADDRNSVVRSDDRLFGGGSGSSRGPRPSDGDADTLDELRPDVAAPGTSIMSAMFHTFNQYWALTGTSMAAPHVAGTAALILQANPELRPVDQGNNNDMAKIGAVPVRDILQKTAQYKTATQGTPVQQAGVGKFGLPWNNGWGYGLIDAYAAVQMALILNVDAPARIQGATTEAIPLAAVAAGGAKPYAIAWTTSAPCAFADASALATTVTCTAVGRHDLTLTVTDASAVVVVRTTKAVVGDRITLLANDVESGSPGWSAPAGGSGQLASWHTTTAKSTSPTTSWYQGIDAIARYPPTQNVNLLSPAGLDLSGAMEAKLTFAIQGDREAGFDFLNVQWHQGAGAFQTAEAISGAFPAFTTKTVDLKNALGNNNVQLRFNAFSDDNTEGEGYYLDDFRLTKITSPPDSTPPTQVTGLLVQNTGTGTGLSLLWSPSVDDDLVSTYRVYRATASGPLATKTLVGSTPSLAFLNTGLTAGATYYYQVLAVDPAGNVGAESDEVSGVPVFVPDTTPPSAPAPVVARDLGRSGAVRVDWGAATDDKGVATYVVERDAGSGFAPLASFGASARNLLDAGLTDGAAVTYRVAAIDTSGNQGPWTEAGATPTAGTSAWPMAHRDASATGVNPAQGWVTVPEVRLPTSVGGLLRASPLIADLDLDGDNDVVVVSDMASASDRVVVTVLSGTPLAVQWRTTVPAPATLIAGEPFNPTTGFGRAAVGDLTGDGHPDVALSINYAEQVANGPSLNSGRLVILDGTDGAILGETALTIAEPAHPVIGDVNVDGLPDVVLIHTVGGTAPGTYVGGWTLGGGTLIGLFDLLFTAGAADAAPVLAEVDSNHPGFEVFVADGADSNTAGKVYLCRPFAATPSCGTSVSLPTGVIALAAADLDGDDRDEIVANGRTGASLAVVEYVGPGMTATTAAAGSLWNTPVLVDIDGDGRRDIANVEASNFANDVAKAGHVRVHGYAAGVLTQKAFLDRTPAAGGNSQSPGGASAADIDRDGVADLVYATAPGTLQAVKLVAGTPVPLWSATLRGAATAPVALGDVDGDGYADAVVPTENGFVWVVTHQNIPPVLTVPATASGTEGALLSFGVSATDAESDPISLGVVSAPAGVGLVDHGDGTATVTWTPTHAQAGTHTVTIAAFDGEDQTTAATTITVGNTNLMPTASFTMSPTSGVTKSTTVTAVDTSTDPDGTIALRTWTLSLVADSTPDGVADSPGVLTTANGPTFSFRAPDDGSYAVTLTVQDSDGALATASQSLTVGNIPPTVSSSAPAYARVGAPASFQDLSTDADGAIALREWDMNGDGVFEKVVTGTSFTHVFPTEGSILVRHRVTDTDGASSARQMTVIADGTPPVTTVTAPAVPASGWYDGPVDLTVTRADAGGSGIGATTVTVDGTGSPRGGNSAFTVPVAGEGTHVVQYASRDRAFNQEATRTLLVKIDEAAPSVTVTKPAAAPGAAVHGGVAMAGDTVPLEADAGDTGSGVAQVEFFVDGSSVGVDTDGTDGWTGSWDTTGANTGSYEIRAVATDVAGRTAQSAVAMLVLVPTTADVTVDAGFSATNDCDILVGAACAGGDRVSLSGDSTGASSVDDEPEPFGITQGVSALVGLVSDGLTGGEASADAGAFVKGQGCSAAASTTSGHTAGCTGVPSTTATVTVVGENDCDILLPTACSGGDTFSAGVGPDLASVDGPAPFGVTQGASAWLGYLGDGATGGYGGFAVDVSSDAGGCSLQTWDGPVAPNVAPALSCSLA